MHRLATLGLLLAFATACPADPDPANPQGSSTEACGTGTCGEPSSSSGLPPDGSSDACGTGGCYDTTSTTTDGTTSTEAGDSTTEGPGVEPPCGFGPTLEGLAMGKTDPTDCGTVTLEDDAAAWQAASDCAAAAAAAQEAFHVAFQLPSDDSAIFEGFYGVVGIVYGLGELYTDTFGMPMLQSQSCTDVAALDGCMVDVGVHCLECVGAGEPVALDCAM